MLAKSLTKELKRVQRKIFKYQDKIIKHQVKVIDLKRKSYEIKSLIDIEKMKEGGSNDWYYQYFKPLNYFLYIYIHCFNHPGTN